MRLPCAVLILLAACSGRDAADEARPTDAATADASTQLTKESAAAADADPPDFADPRLFLNLDSLDWAQWETGPRSREARLLALGIHPVRDDRFVEAGAGENDPEKEFPEGDLVFEPTGERPEDFHFVDFSGDGVADVIYDGAWYVRNENGFGAREGNHLKLYQVIDGRAVEVMDHHGSVQRIWKGGLGQPISFRTVHYGCCSDPSWSIEYFRPVRTGDTVRFERRLGVLGRAEMDIPTRFMAAPRRFAVANDGYLLRGSPRVQDSKAGAYPEWYEWDDRGNVMAEYGRGARGTALAERTDSTGRVWCFVRMDGATPPRAAQFDAPVDHADRVLPVDRLGWMSSRFLTPEP